MGCQEHSPADLSRLWEAHRRHLERYLHWLGCDTDLVDDIVQETYARAAEYFRKTSGGKLPPLNWLRATARHLLVDFHRRKTCARVLVDGARRTESASRDLETRALGHELLRLLSERPRRIVYAFYWLGKTEREIAREEGVSARAIEAVLRRARRSLRTRGLEPGCP